MSPIKYMRHIIALLAATAPAALGGISATVSSSDLIKKPAFDNIKAVWDSDLTLAGSKAKLSLAYDFKAKKDFVKEVAVAGAVADIKYAVTHAISSGVTGLTLMTKQMGHNLKVVGDSSDCVTQIAASGSCSVGDFDVSYTPSYQIKKKLSKLSLSAALGHGLSASGTLSATTAGEVGADYEVGYDTSLGEGRSLSATVHPADKTADVEVVDSTTESGATWTAAIGLSVGSKPSLTLRRSTKL